jgi:glucose-6-phosphate-specific signal transduction histidine kinase
MEVTRYIPLNWEIIKHPVNWLIVLLMVILAGFIIDITIAYFQTLNTQEQ